MLQSVEQQLVEALDAIAEKNPKTAELIFKNSTVTVEEKLAATRQALASDFMTEIVPAWRRSKESPLMQEIRESLRITEPYRTPKHNGVGDNRRGEESDTASQVKLQESFMALGLSKAEAKIAAMSDEEVIGEGAKNFKTMLLEE
jgi:hypothetical protein